MGKIEDSVKNTKELITYYYHTDTDIGLPNIKQGFTIIDSHYISDNAIPISDYNNTKFKSIDISDPTKVYKYTYQTNSSSNLEYVEFELEYGEEFYCYLKDEEGYEGGSLSKYYGISLDKDISIDATDAIPITLFVSIEPKRHTNINIIYEGKVINKNSSSVEVPYGAYIKATVTSDNGYKPSTIILDGYDTERNEVEFNVNEDTCITTQEVASNTVGLSVTSPKNTTVKFSAEDGKYSLLVPPEFTKTINSIPLYSQYLMIVSTSPGLRPGRSNIPLYGTLRPSMVDNDDIVRISIADPYPIMYDITVIQNDPNQTINVLDATTGESYTTSFKAQSKDKLIVTVDAKLGYTAGRPSVEECIVNGDMNISAYPSAEKEFTLFINSPAHMTCKLILPNRLIEVQPNENKSFIHVNFGLPYHLEITPDTGYSYPELSAEISDNIIGITTPIISYDFNKNEAYVNMDPPTADPVYVYIKQSPHQKIYISYNNETYTESFIAYYDDKIKARIESTEEFYSPGTINIGDNEYTLKGDTSIYATEAVKTQFNVIIPNYPNQIITVTYNNKEYTESFKVYPHDNITVSIDSSNDLFSPGLLKFTEMKDITSDIVVEATPAVKSGMYTVRYTSTPDVNISMMHNGVLVQGNVFVAKYSDTYYIQVDSPKHIEGDINYPHSGIIVENMDIVFNRKE